MITKVILDFETSGLNPYHDDIIEIAVKVMNSDKQFSKLIQPKSNECISEEISSLTGITNKMLHKEGISWKESYELFNSWLFSARGDNEKISIISHNGESFDFIFLRRILNDLKKLGIKPFPLQKIIFIDTLLLAKRLVPRRMSYKQSSLCLQYNIENKGCHRAMNDIIALEKIFIVFIKMLNKELNKRQDVSDYPQMVENYIKLI